MLTAQIVPKTEMQLVHGELYQHVELGCGDTTMHVIETSDSHCVLQDVYSGTKVRLDFANTQSEPDYHFVPIAREEVRGRMLAKLESMRREMAEARHDYNQLIARLDVFDDVTRAQSMAQRETSVTPT